MLSLNTLLYIHLLYNHTVLLWDYVNISVWNAWNGLNVLPKGTLEVHVEVKSSKNFPILTPIRILRYNRLKSEVSCLWKSLYGAMTDKIQAQIPTDANMHIFRSKHAHKQKYRGPEHTLWNTRNLLTVIKRTMFRSAQWSVSLFHLFSPRLFSFSFIPRSILLGPGPEQLSSTSTDSS